MEEFRGGLVEFLGANQQRPTKAPWKARVQGASPQGEHSQTGARADPTLEEGLQRSHPHCGGNEDELVEPFAYYLVPKSLKGPVDFFADTSRAVCRFRGGVQGGPRIERGRRLGDSRGGWTGGREGVSRPLAGARPKFFFGKTGYKSELAEGGGDITKLASVRVTSGYTFDKTGRGMEQKFNFPGSSSEALVFQEKFLENRFSELGEVSDRATPGRGDSGEGTGDREGRGVKSCPFPQ